ncbi:TM2 domain-containing protein [Robertkochia sediminum]|uniref:TM2 domain-containing protein n=1 Tax=Robertkochia sediminum TaxID=2785326 RepID=UPI0019317F5E|nr:TM2 domain-containing protein [Robertkochia sediminum]MBL7472346.1 TM2 domain-containing protein [Robertkochia sediminum]
MSEKDEDLGEKARKFFDDAGREAKETAKEFSDSAKQTFKDGENKRILVGVIALLLGAFGVHKFVLGYNKEGFVMLGVSLLAGAFTCGMATYLVAVVGLIEGVIYLTKSDIEFYNTYIHDRKPWF